MAQLNLKFVNFFLVALELHFAVLFVGTLVFGHDHLAWRTAEHSEKQASNTRDKIELDPSPIQLWLSWR
jgi:hypothetical protein